MHLFEVISFFTVASTAALVPFHVNQQQSVLSPFRSQDARTETQQPLGSDLDFHVGVESDDHKHINITEQDSSLCDAGSRHWTGHVQITEEKSMFFWYFESRGDPKNDPVLLWMSGGPGATGEFGIFRDIGPCHVNGDGNSTTRATHTWTEHANVLFIDQPIGVGFSQVKDRSYMATNLRSGARDIYSFLSIFATEALPELADHTWHITGESMGGHYTTGYTQYMLEMEEERRQIGLPPMLPFQIESIIAVDAYIDASRQSVGYYEFFCLPRGDDKPIMNETACAGMAAAVPECERLGAMCRDSYDPVQCQFTAQVCDETVGKSFFANVKPGGWNPYDSRKKCTEPPLCSDLDGGPTVQFLNRPWVQERLGFSENFTFEIIDFELNQRWVVDGNLYLPTTRQLTWLLDKTDIRVLFINGNNDMLVNTPGQMRILNEQPWHQQAQYRSKSLQDWHFRDGRMILEQQWTGAQKGGQWKRNDRLGLFSVDNAGHMAPFDNAEAVVAILDYWIDV